jgi:hypothetical protein
MARLPIKKLADGSSPGSYTHVESAYIRAHHMGGIIHSAAVETGVRRSAQQMKPCPTCGHVYKHPGLAGPDGTCLNPVACARHLKRGY